MKETKQFCTGTKLETLHNLILKLTVQVQEDHILRAGVAHRHVDKKQNCAEEELTHLANRCLETSKVKDNNFTQIPHNQVVRTGDTGHNYVTLT